MKKLVILLLVLGLLAGAGLFSKSLLAGPAGPIYDLTSVRPERVFAARLSIETEYQPCRETPPPDSGTVPGVQCGDNGDIPTHLARLAALRESLDPDSLQGAAQAIVLWGDTKESSLNESIALLEKALALAPDRVSLLVDLSALYLARAERAQSPRDLTLALERALEAVRRDPRNRAALYNAALASQVLLLDTGAKSRWDAYLAVDSTSPWAAEANKKRRALLTRPATLDTPTLASSVEEVNAFVARHPYHARIVGWDSMLGAWGSAVLHDSVARADSLLRLAGQLGAALEKRGDTSLAEAVGAIRKTPLGLARHTLARAHRAYARGQALFTADRKAARASFAEVMELQPASPVLIDWASAFYTVMLVYTGDVIAANASIDPLLSEARFIRHPVLIARLNWIRGKALFDEAEFAEARGHYHLAARTYERLSEPESYGATRYMEGLSSNETGDSIAGYRMVHQAVEALRPYHDSARLSSILFDMAKYTAADGTPWASTAILDEALVVALAANRPVEIAQVLIAKEAHRTLTGEPRRPNRDLDSAEILLARVGDSTVVKRLRSMRAVTDARAPAELDSAVAFFTKDYAVWLMTALMRRAELYIAVKDFEGAGADLDSVTAHFWRTSQGEKNFHNRTAVMEQARSLFDKLVLLHADARRPVESLRALERGRVSFAPGGDAQNPGGPLMSPPNQVALEYALIRNQLLVWMVRGRTVTLFRRTVNRDAVLYAIDQANAALESVKRADAAQTHLRHLHNWLIRPVRDSLSSRDTSWVIVADGEIAGVPFAALRDAERQRYLVEDALLRFAATLAEAGQPPQPAPRGRRPLLIADPEFDQKEHSTLDPLGGARREMNSLLQFYPDADTLSGTNATVDALRTRAPRASVIHYAGHAIFDDTRPERSFLVLSGTGRLAADTVSSMDLQGVRMVVLSACRTLRARQGRSGGFAGLSGALLNAGAGGVVGSLWKVDDGLAQPLMVAFHREYQRDPDPAQALRTAQLEMLDSEDDRQKSPAAWAGFRYVGR